SAGVVLLEIRREGGRPGWYSIFKKGNAENVFPKEFCISFSWQECFISQDVWFQFRKYFRKCFHLLLRWIREKCSYRRRVYYDIQFCITGNLSFAILVTRLSLYCIVKDGLGSYPIEFVNGWVQS